MGQGDPVLHPPLSLCFIVCSRIEASADTRSFLYPCPYSYVASGLLIGGLPVQLGQEIWARGAFAMLASLPRRSAACQALFDILRKSLVS